jgi:hypothetical protein
LLLLVLLLLLLHLLLLSGLKTHHSHLASELVQPHLVEVVVVNGHGRVAAAAGRDHPVPVIFYAMGCLLGSVGVRRGNVTVFHDVFLFKALFF